MKLQVKVTQKHIEDGQAGNCAHCPIALAILELEEIQGKYSVTVLPNEVQIFEIGKEELNPQFIYGLPHNAKCFIIEFDQCWPTNPFEFELKNPFYNAC